MGKTKTPTPYDQKSSVKNPKDEWFEQDAKNGQKQQQDKSKKKN